MLCREAMSWAGAVKLELRLGFCCVPQIAVRRAREGGAADAHARLGRESPIARSVANRTLARSRTIMEIEMCRC